MLKKFALWFICFVLSFLVSNVFGRTEQGKAFMYINLCTNFLIILGQNLILIITGFVREGETEVNGIFFFTVLFTIKPLAIILFVTWVATKLFNIDFFVTYQIVTLGQCLCADSE